MTYVRIVIEHSAITFDCSGRILTNNNTHASWQRDSHSGSMYVAHAGTTDPALHFVNTIQQLSITVVIARLLCSTLHTLA